MTSPKVDTYHDPVRAKRYRERIYPRIDELGLKGKIPPCVVPRPYTRNAYLGLYFARHEGRENAYVDAVMDAYYVKEQDIGNLQVLVHVAEQIGLNSVAFKKALLESTDLQELIRDEEQVLSEYEIAGLPILILNGKTVITGTYYTVEELAEMISGTAEVGHNGWTFHVEKYEYGDACGIHGCE